MDLELKNKVAVVGGASKGLGRACAEALAEEGVKLVMCSRTQADLEQAAQEIRKHLLAHELAKQLVDDVEGRNLAVDRSASGAPGVIPRLAAPTTLTGNQLVPSIRSYCEFATRSPGGISTALERNFPMPILRLSPDFEMHYVIDDFTDPWRKPGTILMLHGNHESSFAWYGWVPHLARRYRVVRPDMRGFGASTPMPRDFPWTLNVLIDDYVRLLDALEIDRCHVVSAKIGGIIGRAFAARRPDRVRTLTVVGSPPPVRSDLTADEVTARIKEMEEHGIEPWARRSMTGRLGSSFPAEGVAWWIEYMSRTSVSTEIGFVGTINVSDITADMPKIKCPMLVITTEGSGLASVGQTRAWQQQVPNSELVVLPGDSFHIAATDPERCAQATLEFIARNSNTV